MAGYRYLVDGEVAEQFLSVPFRNRERLLSVFRQIADNPYQEGETSFQDSVGRKIQKRQFGAWQISYWSDHAVKEVRIVGIQKTRR